MGRAACSAPQIRSKARGSHVVSRSSESLTKSASHTDMPSRFISDSCIKRSLLMISGCVSTKEQDSTSFEMEETIPHN